MIAVENACKNCRQEFTDPDALREHSAWCATENVVERTVETPSGIQYRLDVKIVREGPGESESVRSVSDIAKIAQVIVDKKREHLLVVFLNARQQVIAKEIVSIGTLTASLAHPREIFAPAIGKAAAAVILIHNHPSGDPSPSDEDVRLTKRISQAGHILGIDLLDHLIVGTRGVYSFKAAGAL